MIGDSRHVSVVQKLWISKVNWINLFIALQAGLSFIGEQGVTVKFIQLQLNMYTAPAILAAAFGLINILLVVLVLRWACPLHPLRTGSRNKYTVLVKQHPVFSTVVNYRLFWFLLTESTALMTMGDSFNPSTTHQMVHLYVVFFLLVKHICCWTKMQKDPVNNVASASTFLTESPSLFLFFSFFINR